MSCTDWAQIISAIATVAATLIALITTIINVKYNKRIENDKHDAVKPNFIINMKYENWVDYELIFRVVNFGFDKYSKIYAFWEGLDDVEVSIVYNFNKSESPHDFIITTKFNKHDFDIGDINCNLCITYRNIYGKPYTEKIDVLISTKYYDLVDVKQPNLIGDYVQKQFL